MENKSSPTTAPASIADEWAGLTPDEATKKWNAMSDAERSPVNDSTYADITKIIFEHHPRIKGAYCALIAYGVIDYFKARATAPASERFADLLRCQREQAETQAGDPYMVGLYNGMAMMCANFDNSPKWEPLSTAAQVAAQKEQK